MIRKEENAVKLTYIAIKMKLDINHTKYKHNMRNIFIK